MGSSDAPVSLVNDVDANRAQLGNLAQIDGGNSNAVCGSIGIFGFIHIVQITEPNAVLGRDGIGDHAVSHVRAVVTVCDVNLCVENFFAQSEIGSFSRYEHSATCGSNQNQAQKQCKSLFHVFFLLYSFFVRIYYTFFFDL